MLEIISIIFNSFLYQPLLNFLLFLYNILGDFGLAIIVLTLIIKIITNPLNKKSLESQKKMAEIQPLIKRVQKEYKDREQQGRELLKVYKENNFNPFAGIFVLFLQIPIFFALFKVFQSGIDLAKLEPYIYSFISLPETINPVFLTVDLSQPNMFLALITAILQFIQVKTATIQQQPSKEGEKDQMEQITEMIQKQTMFFVPAVIFFVLFNLPAALGLYWSITTVLNIIQQRKIFNKK